MPALPVAVKCPECPHLGNPAQPCLCHRPRADPDYMAWVAEIMAEAGGDLDRAIVLARRARKVRLPLGVSAPRPPQT